VEKLLKKLEETTGKKAKIVLKEEEEENCGGNNNNHNEFIGVNCYENLNHENHDVNQDWNMLDGFGEDYIMRDITLFSDENANACIIL
jgi:hypothetical protein